MTLLINKKNPTNLHRDDSGVVEFIGDPRNHPLITR